MLFFLVCAYSRVAHGIYLAFLGVKVRNGKFNLEVENKTGPEKVCVIMGGHMQILVECVLFYEATGPPAWPPARPAPRPQVWTCPTHAPLCRGDSLDLDPEEQNSNSNLTDNSS